MLPQKKLKQDDVSAQIAANSVRTWDHIVPASCGGKLMIPACAWCNNTKGDRSLGDWLNSDELAMRCSMIVLREPDAEPMHPRLLDQLKDEDLERLRKLLAYHAET